MPQFPFRAVTLSTELLEDRLTPANFVLPDASQYVAGDVLFSLANGVNRNETLMALATSPWGSTATDLGFGVFKLTLKQGVTVQEAMDGLDGNGHLGFVQPDYKRFTTAVPNDPSELDGTLWAHNNTGQNGGTAGADISAYQGWNFGTGTGDHIVAVLDTGVDYTHPDLAANMWVNPNPTNGDIHGYNFVENNGDPMPGTVSGNDHGTHVAGIIGGVGNNGVGISGVAWKTRIMALRFIDGDNGGATSAEIQGINYAVSHGASIINGSYGGQFYNPAEEAAFGAATAQGVIFAIAAGNSGLNNDTNTFSPANFSVTNNRVVTVAATDRNDQLASFSDYGLTSVTLGAPGVEIYSTLPGNQYGLKDGTSMATPQVAGALAVVWDAFPYLSPDELISLLKSSTDPLPSLDGKTVTGGRLDLAKMFESMKLGGYAVAPDAGGGPNVKVYSSGGSLRNSFNAYDANFTGGVRLAYVDVNGDKVPDIITTPGAGGGPNVRVFDGKSLQLIYSFNAYDSNFTKGLFVAAGDVNGDGSTEIVTSADMGGGPNIRVFKLGANGLVTLESSFYAYAPSFTGGVRVAVGDYNNDGAADIITSPGFGGNPQIVTYDGLSASQGKVKVLRSFMANTPMGVGAYIAVGDMNNDGTLDYVVGAGAGSRDVRVYDGRSLAFIEGFNVLQPGASTPIITNTTTTTTSPNGLNGNILSPVELPGSTAQSQPATSPPTTPYTGMRVAVADLNADGSNDIIAIGGPGDQSMIRLRNGKSMTTLVPDRDIFSSNFIGGAFVAATS